ncbi:hypothetical protein BG006_005312 [Podila minutissima]|uniref:Uncharacterized protein n=1 Tax=Podila minutissima TaxID=64525 RepID=A0A9P5STL3_9FUNG|nr:hypothetical protein BG006_005312 [Podila minutissima]
MPILRSLPILHTYRTPQLDLKGDLPHDNIALSSSSAEPNTTTSSSLSIHGAPLYQNDYPPELFQVRARAIQTQLATHPSTLIYLFSLATVAIVLIVFLATVLGLQVTDGKPWVLGVIVIMILLFISKMTFLSRMEKANKHTMALLQSINEQDMPRYGVLYRLRPREPVVSSWPIRVAYRLNLGLPCWTIDLTTIDHIDEHSFGRDPALDPHATVDEILARENELPTYQPKAEEDDDESHGSGDGPVVMVLREAQPPQYDDVVETPTRQAPSAGISSS